VVADDATLRRRLPRELEREGFGVYVAHGVSDALELAKEIPPRAVVLDLFHGSEDAWRRIKPAINGSRLIVAGKFTTASVAERMHPDAYVANGDVAEIIQALRSLNGAHPV